MPAGNPHINSSIASTFADDNRERISVIVCRTEEKSFSDRYNSWIRTRHGELFERGSDTPENCLASSVKGCLAMEYGRLYICIAYLKF